MILCTYVLNVIENDKKRLEIIEHIRSLLEPGGIAYISVRNDTKNLTGYRKGGTWQGKVDLTLPVIVTNSRFKIYKMVRS